MIIQEIVDFFKRIFNKEEERKLLIEPKIQEQSQKIDFIKSIKIEPVNKKKRTVETPICFGDGLGIQTKVRY